MAERRSELEREALLQKAMDYLLGAGWIMEPYAPRTGIAMLHCSDERTLRLRFHPDEGFVLVHIAFRGAASPGWLFRGGETELRFYVDDQELIGLLCRITSSQDSLWPDVASEWIDNIIDAYPDAYAIIATTSPKAEPLLAQVVSNKATRIMH